MTYPQPVVGRRIGRKGGAANCIYCGSRCAPYYLACYKHADLPALDTLSPQLLERVTKPRNPDPFFVCPNQWANAR